MTLEDMVKRLRFLREHLSVTYKWGGVDYLDEVASLITSLDARVKEATKDMNFHKGQAMAFQHELTTAQARIAREALMVDARGEGKT